MFRKLASEERESITSEYLMITSVELRNFRCFKSATASGLKRINIVVGRNGTGKTAFLESLWLASGSSPTLALRLRNFRGMGAQVKAPADNLSEIWNELAYGFNMDEPVSITMTGSSNDSRSLKIEGTGRSERTVSVDDNSEPDTVTLSAKFIWTGHNEREPFETQPKITPQGQLAFVEAPPTNVRASMFAANFSLDPEEASRRISDIRKRGDLHLLLGTITEVFPYVTDISAESSAGVWLPHVAVKGVQRMIPAALYSAGTARFIAFLAAIGTYPRGVILADEIENGLYYKTYSQAWQALYRFCVRYDTQLFASTHSRECLEAAKPLIESHTDDFAFIRANQDDTEHWLDCFEGDRLLAALEQGFELR